MSADNYLAKLTFADFKQQLATLTKSKHLVVAYSGGMDSRVLLELVAHLVKDSPEYTAEALHINHQLQQDANLWQQHCEEQCDNLGMKITSLKVVVNAKLSVETAARNARYAAFNNFLPSSTALLLAHHADDHVETVLLRLFRGTGEHGLQGIPAIRKLGQGTIIRPLLKYSNAALHAFAKAQQLVWLDDPTNSSIKHSRNIIRHKILPEVNKYFSSAATHVCNLAQLLQRQQCELQPELQARLVDASGTVINSLSINKLTSMSAYWRNLVLRQWILSQGYQLPSYNQLERIYSEIMLSKNCALAQLKIADYVIRRYRDDLFLLEYSSTRSASKWSYIWQEEVEINLPTGQTLTKNFNSKPDMEIVFCNRVSGHKVRKIFQQYSIPPWQRDRYILVLANNVLKQIIGLWVKPGWEFAFTAITNKTLTYDAT